MMDQKKTKDQLISELEELRQEKHERKQADKALKQSEDRLSMLFEFAPDAYYLSDRKGTFLDGNKAAEDLIGYKKEELIGRSYLKLNLLPSNQIFKAANLLARNALGKPTGPDEFTLIRKDGVHVSVEIRTYPIKLKNETVVLGIAHDITDRKKKEVNLLDERNLLRTLIDSLPDLIYIKDSEKRFVLNNTAHLQALGATTQEEVLGKTDFDIFPKELATQYNAVDQEVLQTGHPITNLEEFFINLTTGDKKRLLTSIVPLRDIDDRIAGLVGISKDITERKQMEEALRESEERYRNLVETSQNLIFRTDKEGRFIYLNKAWENTLGYKTDEMLGKKHSDFKTKKFAERDIKEFAKVLKVGEVRGYETQYISKSGNEVFLIFNVMVLHDSNGNVVGGQGTAFDITERKSTEEALRESEEHLRQAQKLESIGRLAGGIAHDFNNLLTTILGYSELISMEQDLTDTTRESVREIKNSAERAATLIQQLLAFSRKQVLKPQVIDLNRLITRLGKMLRRLIGEDINLTTKLDSNLEKIKADPGQMEQVIMNLVVNARDAMSRGGTITIETLGVNLDESYHQQHPEVTPGDYVLLAVSDTGQGMDEETRKHIFEPFFTTKEVGKGTGLGLSTAYGIVKQSGGYISVYSEPEQGTTFKIYLPQLTGTKKQQESLREKRDPLGGTETILLVEDEESLRKMAGKILAGYGYSVVEAKNGMEALEIAIKGDRLKIDLLVTDVIMPKMGGKELSEKLFEEYPKLKVLYISGYTDNAIAHHGMLDKGVLLLQKPFSPQSLAVKVREVLDEG